MPFRVLNGGEQIMMKRDESLKYVWHFECEAVFIATTL